MLPKKNRLKKKKDFEEVFKMGKGARSGFLLAKFKDNPKLTRLAVVVSKKFSLKAVKRNRIRRKIVEAAKNLLPPGKDIVINVIPGAKEENVEQELKTLFSKM